MAVRLWNVIRIQRERFAVFLQIHPETLVFRSFRIAPVGEGVYFNINRIGFARFRTVTMKDLAGTGADSDLAPVGSLCIEISIDGNLAEPATVLLVFPEWIKNEYERMRRIVESRLLS